MHGRRVFLPALLAAGVVAAVVGCSGTPQGSEQTEQKPPALRPTSLPPAAEPARPPPKQAEEPAGTVIKLDGETPEGIAADPATHIVAVGLRKPTALALIDGRTGEQVDTVPMPGRFRHLQIADPGGPVLVPVEGANALVKVALPSGKKIAQIRTGRFPHGATEAANGTIFVANEFGGTVVALRDGKIVRTFKKTTQPAVLAPVGNTVALVDVRQNNLTLYDAERLRRLGSLPAGKGPTHVVSSPEGLLAVTDTRGDAVMLYSLDPQPRRIGKLELPGSPYGIAYDAANDLVWVTLTAKNQVVAIDATGAEPKVVKRLPTVRQPNTVDVDDATGRVFITGTARGVLQIIDP